MLLLLPIVLWDLAFLLKYLLHLGDERKRNWLPRVSILIPAYNEGETILRAVTSALAQDYPDFEVIVVDDGSVDNTFEQVSQIEDPRLKVYRKEHGGKAKALNFGLSKASGEVIVTTDADSCLEPTAVGELVRRFHSGEVVGVGGQVRVMGESILERAQDIEHLRIAALRRARELEDLSIAPGPISAFRRSALERIGGFVEDIVEDYATTKAIKRLGKVVYAPRARVWTEMPKSLRVLWRQRKRWFEGDLNNLDRGLLPSLLLGDAIAFLDVLVPVLLLATGDLGLFVLWWAFESLTFLPPTVVEKGKLSNVAIFPAVLWFWALFYLSLHVTTYAARFLRGTRHRIGGWE